MDRVRDVKKSVSLLVSQRVAVIVMMILAVCVVAIDFARAQAPGEVSTSSSEHACDARENIEGFPQSLRFRIVNQDELDARGIDRKQKESDTVRLRRIDYSAQPKTGVFSVSGQLGISGDAKLLVTKDALRFGEVGMAMIVNHSIRETVIYQCRKI